MIMATNIMYTHQTHSSRLYMRQICIILIPIITMSYITTTYILFQINHIITVTVSESLYMYVIQITSIEYNNYRIYNNLWCKIGKPQPEF